MSDQIQKALVKVCQRLLPPIVRLLLPFGINCREFIELAKRAYVNVITDEHGLDGRPANISKTAILSGLTRPEVTRLRNERKTNGSAQYRDERRYNMTELLTEWHNDSYWCEIDGRPSELPYEGEERSFDTLVQRHFGNVPMTAVLRELKDVGAVESLEGKRVRALRTFYRPKPMTSEHAELVGALIADFVTTVHTNLHSDPEDDRLVEYRVVQMDVPQRHQDVFHAMLDDETRRYMERVDKWLHDKKTYESEKDEPVVRMGVGVYQIGK